MERINNMVSVLLSFSLFPFGITHSTDNIEKTLSKFQNTNQDTDRQNMSQDWQNVGQDIACAIEKLKDEQ